MSDNHQDPFRRNTVLIASRTAILRPTDAGFRDALADTFSGAESWMLEGLIQLKRQLRNANNSPLFWNILMEGMTEFMGCQYSFVAKRVLVDDDKTAVEMPPYGEPGSCLMGMVFYFNDHNGQTGFVRDVNVEVYGTPCEWMKHDRVLIIPERLAALTPDNPHIKRFPIPAEAYIAVPLFWDGKCLGHFGSFWTVDGLKKRPQVSWGMLEMFLHTIEDLVTARLVGGSGLGLKNEKGLVPHHMVTENKINTALRPNHARRLSHELRTPMQGVIGMLDVMYASVLEATCSDRLKWSDPNQLKEVIEGLRISIEVAQDSSKRAVDVADNMVHAYESSMEASLNPPLQDEDHLLEETATSPNPVSSSRKVDSSCRRKLKRRRSSEASGRGSPHKLIHIESAPSEPTTIVVEHALAPLASGSSLCAGPLADNSESTAQLEPRPPSGYFSPHFPTGYVSPITPNSTLIGHRALNSRPLRLRDLLHAAVHESIRTGGRPDFTNITETSRGERVIVKISEGRKGEQARKLVEIDVIVDKSVPEFMNVDETYLLKMISSVFHNAFKFTPSGHITLEVSLNGPDQMIFSIIDTGDGIPSNFIPALFKPFSTENESLTRHREGLGLGLYVAKGIARKLGGDLWLERTSIEGDNRGSEFKIRLPIAHFDVETPETLLQTPATPLEVVRLDISPFGIRQPRSAPSKRTGNRRKLSFDPELGKKLPLRILVVEDNRINRALLCTMLKRLGYNNIEEACDGVQAVELFEAALKASLEGTGDCFDLVLMDLWMPRMDGYEATEQILKLCRGMGLKKGISSNGKKLVQMEQPVVTVLAVSADTTEEAKAKAIDKGIRGFVGKPFGILDLGRAVCEFGGRRGVSFGR